jgi:hypothetical protein
MRNIGRLRHGVTLWSLWTLANLMAMGVGGAAIEWSGPMGLVLFGACAGGAQWLVLAQYRRVSRWWLVATTAGNLFGWMGGLFVVYVLFLVLSFVVDVLPFGAGRGEIVSPVLWRVMMGVVGGLFGGLSVGSAQDMRFDRQTRSVGWIIASSLGGAIAGAISGMDLTARMFLSDAGFQGLPRMTGSNPWLVFANGATSGAVFGVAYGAVTGLGLVLLLRWPRPAAQLDEART